MYLGFPVILATVTNFRLVAQLCRQSDVIVIPDSNVVPFLIFLAYWESKPILFNTHTNFRHILDRGSFLSRHFVAPIMDNTCKMCTQLATEAWTTSPSYRDVLLQRGYDIQGVFSPRIKLSVFEKPDSEEAIEEARKFLKGGSDAEYVFITASRWSHEKRIPLLAEKLPSNCCLCVFGDGPESEVEKITALHNPSKKVFVHRGMVNQERLRLLYKASDFLVSASAFETLGMTVAEAHLCGIPAIVQSAPGFVSQIVEDENGFLVDFDAPTAADLIKDCIKRKPTRSQIQKTIDERWDSSLPNLEDVVENVAAKTDRSKWNKLGSGVPVLLWAPFILILYIVYRVSSFPFVMDKKKRHTTCADPSDMQLSENLC